jgi:transcriptional regulator with XRE-family HTH domain
MPDSALGYLLKALREDDKLSLREVAQRADVDHAYIHRLETGAKEAPSEEMVTKLVAALQASQREAQMLQFLAKNPAVDIGLVEHVRGDPTVTFTEFHMATTAVNRGARPDYATTISRIRRIMEE